MPRVSVLMPVYNREKLVGDAIRSIQNQTFQDWELIILDDASSDKTVEVCRSFEAEDKRIHVLVNEQNLGVGASRNRLLSYARGEYVAIQDSDDVSVPERLALEVEILKSKQEIGIVSAVTAWIDTADGRYLWYYPIGLHRGEQYPQNKRDMAKFLYLGCEVAHAACMFRHSLVDQVPNPYGNCRFVDDWYFFLRIAHRTLFWGISRVFVTMRRGKNHIHLCKDFAESKEAQAVIREAYRQYKDDPQSPIDFRLYRRSVSTLLTSKGIYRGGWKGFLYFLQALLWAPHNHRARKSLWEFSSGGFRKRIVSRDDYSKWLEG